MLVDGISSKNLQLILGIAIQPIKWNQVEEDFTEWKKKLLFCWAITSIIHINLSDCVDWFEKHELPKPFLPVEYQKR